MQAERGLIMLLDADGELQMKSAYNLCKEQMMEEDFRISSSITSQVARTGKPVYTSDAMADDRYAHQKSVVELHLALDHVRPAARPGNKSSASSIWTTPTRRRCF